MRVQPPGETDVERFRCLLGECTGRQSPRQAPQWSRWVRYRNSLRGLHTISDYNDDPARLRTLAMPVLVVGGAQTVAFHREINQALIGALPRAEALELDAGHNSPVAAPEPFVDSWNRFEKRATGVPARDEPDAGIARSGDARLGAGRADAGDLHAQDAASESMIRSIVADQVVAWDAGNGDAYAEHLAPDASFTNVFGIVMYGRPAFAKRHSEILATFYKGTTKHHAIRRIRFVTPDVALVDIDNEVRGVKAMPGGIVVPPDGVVKTQLMEVFVRREGRWWIEAYHNVDVKPAR